MGKSLFLKTKLDDNNDLKPSSNWAKLLFFGIQKKQSQFTSNHWHWFEQRKAVIYYGICFKDKQQGVYIYLNII